MSGIIPIFERELYSYFRSPVAYVFIIVFLMASTSCTFFLGGFYESQQASLEIFFLFHPWLYLFLIPAVGMRLWAEERQARTDELLLTFPIHPFSAVLGKFLAGWIFIGLALLLTFPMIITVNYLGQPDPGPIFTGYLGSFLMAGAYLAISICTSALTKNQVISFVLSVVFCLILVLLGWGVLNESLNNLFPVWIADLISQFSFTTHFDAIKRGVIDFADVTYFCSIIGIMLLLNVRIITTSEGR